MPKTNKSKKKIRSNKKKIRRSKSISTSSKKIDNYSKKYQMCIHKKCREYNKLNNELEIEISIIKKSFNNNSIDEIFKKLKKIVNNFEKSTNYKEVRKECQCTTCEKEFRKLYKLLIKELKINKDQLKILKKEAKASSNNVYIDIIDDLLKLLNYSKKELNKNKC